ncbi:MAG: c-type cytochrome domain-containing protein [Planctomycetota bacterium]
MADAVNQSVVQAGLHYRDGKYDDAGKSIKIAMTQIQAAVKMGSTDLYDALIPAIQRVEKAHAMLEFEGVSLPPFKRPARPVPGSEADSDDAEMDADPPKPRRPRSTKPEPEPEPVPTNLVSFTEKVAPILVNRCGNCHVTGSRGNFNMATFAALMKGPPEGVVVFPGDTIGSRLIETIETGDMPRGGGRVTTEELETLKAWVMAGAKFDGTDPNGPISAGAPPVVNMAPRLSVTRATGRETVSFASDVAPLLLDNCNGCHIEAMQTSGGLRMDTFAQLLRGGDTGPIIVPGKSEESLLIQKLRGMGEGQRMPAGGRPALPEEAIQLISTWIDEGATLDGQSESQPIRRMSELAWAATASAEEMSVRRGQLADGNLKLVATSGRTVSSMQTEHFFVTGTASQGTIDRVATLAEQQMKTVKSVVRATTGEEYFHGRATIFVFPKRYDYSEFAKMVEQRGIPTAWQSHWSFDGIDGYLSMVATELEDEEVIAERLTAPLVSLAVASRGTDVPRWLAEGIGSAMASRQGGSRDRDQRREAEQEMVQALSAASNAKEFLDGKLSPEQTDRVGAAIANSMLERTRRRNFDNMLRNLNAGKPFEQAFTEAFGATPELYVQTWFRWLRGA